MGKRWVNGRNGGYQSFLVHPPHLSHISLIHKIYMFNTKSCTVFCYRWVGFGGKVWDLSKFVGEHPGGSELVRKRIEFLATICAVKRFLYFCCTCSNFHKNISSSSFFLFSHSLPLYLKIEDWFGLDGTDELLSAHPEGEGIIKLAL